jgi:hypothetical protein
LNKKKRLMTVDYFMKLYQYWKHLVSKHTRMWLLPLDLKGRKEESISSNNFVLKFVCKD